MLEELSGVWDGLIVEGRLYDEWLMKQSMQGESYPRILEMYALTLWPLWAYIALKFDG